MAAAIVGRTSTRSTPAPFTYITGLAIDPDYGRSARLHRIPFGSNVFFLNFPIAHAIHVDAFPC